jgi:hypothetical protein
MAQKRKSAKKAAKKPKRKPAQPGRKPGRPAEPVPQEMADRIVEWISEGKTLRAFCRQPETPSHRTVYNWRAKDKAFAARFAQARDLGFDQIAEECLEIADDASNDYMEVQTNSGGTRMKFDAEHVNRSRLRIETRLKLLAKWDPRRYGDKDLDVSVHVKMFALPPAVRQAYADNADNVDELIAKRLGSRQN